MSSFLKRPDATKPAAAQADPRGRASRSSGAMGLIKIALALFFIMEQ